MSIILKCGWQICHASTNTSTAKQMYSFSRAVRFPPIRTTGRSLDFYELPSTRSKQFATLGYGKRSDFTLTDKCNKAELYDKGSDFNPQRPHGPKFTFSSGREKYGKVYLDSAKPFDKDVPGPGMYDYLKPFGYGAPSFVMKKPEKEKKNQDDKNANEQKEQKDQKDQKDQKEKRTYLYDNPLQINPKGRYPLSTVRNVNSIKMQYDKTKRNDYVINKNPGPAEYTIKQLFGRSIFDSQYRSCVGVKIASRYKVVDSRSNYPGPGSYRLPSDFGIYVSKAAKDIKYPEENVYPEENKNKGEYDPKPWRHGMKVIKKKTPEDEADNNKDNKDNDNNNNEEENKDENNEDEQNKEEENKEEENKEEENKEEEKNKEEYTLLNDILKEEPEYDDDGEEEGDNAEGGEKAEE